MSDSDASTQSLNDLIQSAREQGIEMDEREASAWLSAMADAEAEAVHVDEKYGVFGNRVTLLDFSPEELGRLRAIAKIVGIPDRAPDVETVIALAGSLAQNAIQANPGDCDYFQRVNIKADSREAAGAILADIMKEKVLASVEGNGFHLSNVQMGSWPEPVIHSNKTRRAGYPISWSVHEVKAGELSASTPDGGTVTIRWGDAAYDPGWTKLDFILADHRKASLVSASNVMDVTWEAPNGDITPLDGFLDPYFQEVYLEESDLPVFVKLAGHVSDDALEGYVEAMTYEAGKYLKEPANYGKAAKRMYNLFRYSGRHHEAVYLRELFDEPATALYGVWSLLETLDQAMKPDSTVDPADVAGQTDQLVLQIVDSLEGEDEGEIVKLLLQLRSTVSEGAGSAAWKRDIKAARDRIFVTVNNFFHSRLTALPEIQQFIEEAQTEAQ